MRKNSGKAVAKALSRAIAFGRRDRTTDIPGIPSAGYGLRSIWERREGFSRAELRDAGAISGIDRAKVALAVGANRFLNYDEWLRIGSLVAQLLELSMGDTPQPPFPTPVRDAQGETQR